MKRNKLYLMIVFILSSTFVFAQNENGDKMWKKFESQKVAYLTQELDLTPQEASKFWPVYYEMQHSLRENEKESRKLMLDLKNNNNLKEKDFENILTKELDCSIKRETIIKAYYKRMLTIISPSRLLKLRKAERNFKKILFNRMGRGKNMNNRK